MRKLPSHIGSPPPVTPKKDESTITQVREYRLITPLFGGGVTPSEADPVTVIRGTTIRGQLRFWWRACRGGLFNGDLAKMKKAEGELWGTAALKGEPNKKENKTEQKEQQTVQISVNKINSSKADLTSLPPYAAFPLQSLTTAEKERAVCDNVSFELIISYHISQREDVEAALWAWETFGGIGARTRRGFGALHLIKVNGVSNQDLPSSNVQEARKWLQQKLSDFLAEDTWPGNVSHLSKTPLFEITRSSFPNEQKAWGYLIEKLRSFRQSRVKGNTGRSNWPEAEAIRQITGRRYYKYRNLQHSQKFPRAAFGLPIVFHFKDTGDPEDTTLQGSEDKHDRLASPLILRPLTCKDGRAVGLALILEGPRIPPGGIMLVEDKMKKQHRAVTTLKPNEANFSPLNGQTDVLKAFLNYL